MTAATNQKFVLWFTGLSGSGKTTLAQLLKNELENIGIAVKLLDGDALRNTISSDLGFTAADIKENQRRVMTLCREYLDQNTSLIVSTISPFENTRQEARNYIKNFIQIYCAAPFEICAARDVKGLYGKARVGLISNFIGKDIKFEPPIKSELTLQTHAEPPEDSLKKIMAYLRLKRYID